MNAPTANIVITVLRWLWDHPFVALALWLFGAVLMITKPGADVAFDLFGIALWTVIGIGLWRWSHK